MTIDEYAQLETANGARLANVDGVWWREVRPFFYQPLFPFLEIVPFSRKTPRFSGFGGYQHLVPSAETANSRRYFFIYDNFYSLDDVTSRKRNIIRKGMRHFSICEIEKLEDLISEGHQVYLSFYERTKYRYKKERRDKKQFAKWAEVLYRHPKIKIIGAYHGRQLSAIDISYLVEDVLIAAAFISRTEHLKYQVADLMTHFMREKAAACSAISCIFKGAATGNIGIDISKLMRGCRALQKPAFYRLNPLAHLVLRSLMPKNYKKLLGEFEFAAAADASKQASPGNDPPGHGKETSITGPEI